MGPGLLFDAGWRIAALAPGAACAIVTDTNVAGHHVQALQTSLHLAGVRCAPPIVVPAGETSKSYTCFAEVCDALLTAKLERRDCVIALGGGVVGDLAGFAAACLKRGLPLVQIPTSLLAQVDSSVGGKTAINSPLGKNLVGAFHQPSLVLADTDVLDTLPEREFRAGYAELVKYGLIDDRGFFEWCERHRAGIFQGAPERVEAVRRAVAAKAAVVARDEYETGDRALLNLGHTFGHALERLAGYDGARLVHGEAVAIGIAMAFRFSVRQGLCAGQDAERVAAHLRAAGLPTTIAARLGPGFASPEAMLDAMAQDKKNDRGRLTLILARGIGESFVARDADVGAVRDFLGLECAA
ncbi:3-dehydroquinate synthase [Lichenihabitans sp. Uapishka_5]|uniref:3-dehydroquinate synthase n=1 Tax=Lichenihabitans sp. Uapishka_5 TaxID=3037302 RepID=UPI0029E7E3CD|nr:3-dehydroquinate synthase [Lichenihabitans sp. Uapishka_5]MDX7953711.1 3-dehydroquinate synthase [Lichenihabitans sp. Uapishka_5]